MHYILKYSNTEIITNNLYMKYIIYTIYVWHTLWIYKIMYNIFNWSLRNLLRSTLSPANNKAKVLRLKSNIPYQFACVASSFHFVHSVTRAYTPPSLISCHCSFSLSASSTDAEVSYPIKIKAMQYCSSKTNTQTQTWSPATDFSLFIGAACLQNFIKYQ